MVIDQSMQLLSLLDAERFAWANYNIAKLGSNHAQHHDFRLDPGGPLALKVVLEMPNASCCLEHMRHLLGDRQSA